MIMLKYNRTNRGEEIVKENRNLTAQDYLVEEISVRVFPMAISPLSW